MYLEECDVIVFDFDGVLVNEDLRPRHLGVSLLKEAIEKGFSVYIVSGRPKEEIHIIKDFLKNINVRPGSLRAIMLRSSTNISERDWKILAYNKIIDKEGCIAEVHDDNPYVLGSIKKFNVGALVLHLPDRCEILKGRSRLSSCDIRFPYTS